MQSLLAFFYVVLTRHFQILVLCLYCTPNDCSKLPGVDLLQLDFVCCLLFGKSLSRLLCLNTASLKDGLDFLFECTRYGSSSSAINPLGQKNGIVFWGFVCLFV